MSDDSAVAVVVAAADYPGPVARGETIGGLDKVAAAGAAVFHAGTRRDGERVLSNGGRVLAAVTTGADPEAARTRAYAALTHLDWPGGRYRRDIAQ